MIKKRVHYFMPQAHFGGCPKCGDPGVLRNYHSDHYFCCDTHRVYWCVGANLFSGWRHETEKDWEANKKIIERYRSVEPAMPPDIQRTKGGGIRLYFYKDSDLELFRKYAGALEIPEKLDPRYNTKLEIRQNSLPVTECALCGRDLRVTSDTFHPYCVTAPECGHKRVCVGCVEKADEKILKVVEILNGKQAWEIPF